MMQDSPPTLFNKISPPETPADVQALLDKGADINEKDEDGDTLLMNTVCRHTLHDLALFLIDKGASLDDKNKHGFTVLHIAATNGFTEIAKRLLEKGADPRIETPYHETPKQLALEHTHTDVAKLIEESEKNPSVPVLARQKQLKQQAPRFQLKARPCP